MPHIARCADAVLSLSTCGTGSCVTERYDGKRLRDAKFHVSKQGEVHIGRRSKVASVLVTGEMQLLQVELELQLLKCERSDDPFCGTHSASGVGAAPRSACARLNTRHSASMPS